MKKYLTLILIVLTSYAFSQGHFVGMKGGLSFSKVRDAVFYAKNIDMRKGFTVGLTYEYKLKNNILLGADLLYMQKGYNFDISFTNEEGIVVGEGKSHHNYNYISLPLKVGYSIGGKVSGFFNLGIVPALLTDAYYDISDPEGILPNMDEFKKQDIKESTPNFELSGLAEIGANYKINESFLLTTAIAGQYGFTAITNFDNVENSIFDSQDNTMKNYGLYWTFGLKYALK